MRATDSGLLPQRHKPQTATETGGGQKAPARARKRRESKDSPSEPRDKLPFLGRGWGMGRQEAPAWAQKKVRIS